MTNSRKIGITFIVVLIIFFQIGLWLIITDDISEKDLGQYPFQVDKTISSENSPELKKIIEIGKKIEGLNEFEEKFKIDSNNPKDMEDQILVFLQKNEKVLLQIEPELFKNCKFPEPRFEKEYSGMEEVKNIVKLKYYQTLFHILLHDFENAKNNLIQLNLINSSLNEKVNSWICQMVVTTCKLFELNGINFLLEQEYFTLDQKIDILNIKQIPISSQNIHQIGYFEEENIKFELNKMNQVKRKSLKDYYFVSYTVKSNKTIKMHRDFLLSAIELLETQNENSFEELKEIYFQKRLIAYKPNSVGKVIMSMIAGVIPVLTKKMWGVNNRQNQLSLAKEILEFKFKTGDLPESLEDLNLDKKRYLDLYTKEPFLYSKENGVLQSVGKNKKNDSVELTTKTVTKKEFFDFLKDGKYSDDFFIYLK